MKNFRGHDEMFENRAHFEASLWAGGFFLRVAFSVLE
jgi:hypothetical protein